jgi:hypothetical protein
MKNMVLEELNVSELALGSCGYEETGLGFRAFHYQGSENGLLWTIKLYGCLKALTAIFSASKKVKAMREVGHKKRPALGSYFSAQGEIISSSIFISPSICCRAPQMRRTLLSCLFNFTDQAAAIMREFINGDPLV